jgi:hypothetical protein
LFSKHITNHYYFQPQRNHFHTTKTFENQPQLFKNKSTKIRVFLRRKLQVFFPTKTLELFSFKSHDQFLIIVDLENFWSPMVLFFYKPRPKTRKTYYHSKFFIFKGIVSSYNIPKSFTLSIQTISIKTTTWTIFKFVSIRQNQLISFSNQGHNLVISLKHAMPSQIRT